MVDAGCVYLFRGGATLVTKNAAQADMGFDGAGLNERVGNRLTCGDLNGDGEADLVICSQNADVQLDVLQQKAGKVYVVWGGSNLATTPVGNASATFVGTNVEDRFGASAAVADVNADGTADLIVGAPQADGTDVDAGKVYVFFGGPTLTGRQSDAADVILAGAPTHNSFGRVVRTGDVNGDSIMDLVIGAPEADYLNDDNGRAYLFLGGPGLANAFAVEAAAIYNGEQIQGEAFGAVVSIVDFNRDGLAEVVGSAPKHDFDAGRIYMWMSQQTGITAVHLAEQADVTFSGLQIGSLFGSQVAKGQ
jgi:hypothetical protein